MSSVCSCTAAVRLVLFVPDGGGGVEGRLSSLAPFPIPRTCLQQPLARACVRVCF